MNQKNFMTKKKYGEILKNLKRIELIFSCKEIKLEFTMTLLLSKSGFFSLLNFTLITGF